MSLQTNHYTQIKLDLQIFTDASKAGWGAHLNERTARGTWSLPESKLHINYLELKAVFLALKEFQDLCIHKIVLVETDNTTVVSYINKEGGTRSGPLCALLWRILTWCTRNQGTLKARHIPVAFVCVTGTGSPGHSSGCAQSAMVGSGGIHLPTISHIGQSGDVVGLPIQENHSDCSGVAQHALVLGSSGHVQSNPTEPAQSAQPVDTTIQSAPSQKSDKS